MTWESIGEVEVSFRRKADGNEKETALVLRPRQRSAFRWSPGGKMVFRLDMTDQEQFVADFNQYIGRHRIRVEDHRGHDAVVIGKI